MEAPFDCSVDCFVFACLFFSFSVSEKLVPWGEKDNLTLCSTMFNFPQPKQLASETTLVVCLTFQLMLPKFNLCLLCVSCMRTPHSSVVNMWKQICMFVFVFPRWWRHIRRRRRRRGRPQWVYNCCQKVGFLCQMTCEYDSADANRIDGPVSHVPQEVRKLFAPKFSQRTETTWPAVQEKDPKIFLALDKTGLTTLNKD